MMNRARPQRPHPGGDRPHHGGVGRGVGRGGPGGRGTGGSHTSPGRPQAGGRGGVGRGLLGNAPGDRAKAPPQHGQQSHGMKRMMGGSTGLLGNHPHEEHHQDYALGQNMDYGYEDHSQYGMPQHHAEVRGQGREDGLMQPPVPPPILTSHQQGQGQRPRGGILKKPAQPEYGANGTGPSELRKRPPHWGQGAEELQTGYQGHEHMAEGQGSYEHGQVDHQQYDAGYMVEQPSRMGLLEHPNSQGGLLEHPGSQGGLLEQPYAEDPYAETAYADPAYADPAYAEPTVFAGEQYAEHDYLADEVPEPYYPIVSEAQVENKQWNRPLNNERLDQRHQFPERGQSQDEFGGGVGAKPGIRSLMDIPTDDFGRKPDRRRGSGPGGASAKNEVKDDRRRRPEPGQDREYKKMQEKPKTQNQMNMSPMDRQRKIMEQNERNLMGSNIEQQQQQEGFMMGMNPNAVNVRMMEMQHQQQLQKQQELLLQQQQMMMVFPETQPNLMEKAGLQMALLEEEKRQEAEQHFGRDMYDHDSVLKAQMTAAEQQLMMLEQQQTQDNMQKQLMMQAQALMEKNQRKPKGDGLLGSGPGGYSGSSDRDRRRGGVIPSIFDVPTKGVPGKRQGAPIRSTDNKRSRPDSQSSRRNRPPSPRTARERRDSGRRSSRWEPESKRKDARTSDSKSRSSPRGQGSTKDRRSTGSADKNRDRGKDNKSGDKTKENKAKVDTPKKDTVKVEDKAKVTGKTEVTIKMGEAYDPAEPTGEIDVKKPVAGVTETVDKPAEVKKENKEVPSVTVTVGNKGKANEAKKDDKTKPKDADKPKDGKKDTSERKKYRCNVCEVECHDEGSFSRHMGGNRHRHKMSIVMTTTTSKSALMNVRKQAEEHLRQIEKPQPKSDRCRQCDRRYTGTWDVHKVSDEHKRTEEKMAAGCKLCLVKKFTSMREYRDHHVQAYHLKQQRRANTSAPRKSKDKDEEFSDLVTLDEVGFEDESTGLTKGEKGSGSMATSTPKPDNKTSVTITTATPILKDGESSDPNAPVGQEFVVNVSGFFCKLCHKFYNNENAAKVVHCQSQTHRDKLRTMQKKADQQQKQKQVAKKDISKQLANEGQGKGQAVDNGETNDKAETTNNGDEADKPDTGTVDESSNEQGTSDQNEAEETGSQNEGMDQQGTDSQSETEEADSQNSTMEMDIQDGGPSDVEIKEKDESEAKIDDATVLFAETSKCEASMYETAEENSTIGVEGLEVGDEKNEQEAIIEVSESNDVQMEEGNTNGDDSKEVEVVVAPVIVTTTTPAKRGGGAARGQKARRGKKM